MRKLEAVDTALNLSDRIPRLPLSRRYRFRALRIVRLDLAALRVVLLRELFRRPLELFRLESFRHSRRFVRRSSSFRRVLRMCFIRQGQALDCDRGLRPPWVAREISPAIMGLGKTRAAFHRAVEDGSRTF